MELQRRLYFIGLACGLFVSFQVMAIAQETIYKSKYDGETFEFPISIVTIQVLFYALVSGAISLAFQNEVKKEVPQKYFIFVALFYLTSMILSSFALQYLSYPAKVIVKSCKPISVMIIGTIIAKKIYTVQKYIFVTMLIVGVSVFLYADGKTSKDKNLIIIGYILVGVSLLMDGMLGAAQDLMRKYGRPSSLHFMFFINAWSALVALIIMLVSGETLPFFEFCIKHPIINFNMTIFIISGCFGQYFLSSLVISFGPLALSLTMTTRKFFTVLFSIFFFNHSFNLIHWLATILIFIALILNVFCGKKEIKCVEDDVKENKEVV